jgi:hypothetical protein
MAIRLLLIIALIFAVIWLLRRWRRPMADSRNVPASETRVLRCAHCDLYVTEQEAVRGADGKVFCSEAHRHAQEDA